jgi:membrane protease YdiL (CAAX protease family)
MSFDSCSIGAYRPQNIGGDQAMTKEQVRDVVVAIIGGMVFSTGLLWASIYFTVLNDQWIPGFPWYPIPVFALVVGATMLVHRQWGIGLTIPAQMPWGRIYAFGLAVTIVGFSISTLQGSYNGLMRGTETGESDVSLAFRIADAFAISITSAALAELGYRGIMQPRLEKVMGVWPAIIIASLINTLSHRWESLFNRYLGIMAIMIGWGYLRHMSGSVVPPLVIHVGMNIVLGIGLWIWGPWDLGAMSMTSIVFFAAAGVIALVASIYIARNVKTGRSVSPSTASV